MSRCKFCDGEVCEVIGPQSARWGEDGPLVSFEDRRSRCQSCGWESYDVKQAQEHTAALLKATVAALTAENERLLEAIKGLPRFECTMGGCGDPECCGSYPEMEPDATGEWVRYADIVAALPSSRETTDG